MQKQLRFTNSSTKSSPTKNTRSNSNSIILFPIEADPVTQLRIEHPMGLKADREFAYDNVFAAEDDQQVLYETSVKPIISKCMKGYNGCIFAYGQTASGKTYSMIIQCLTFSHGGTKGD